MNHNELMEKVKKLEIENALYKNTLKNISENDFIHNDVDTISWLIYWRKNVKLKASEALKK